MEKPKYEITNQLLENIQEIERIYGQLKGIQIPQKLSLNLERDNLLKSSYSSNSIEGNPLTEIEVTNLLLDERIPVNRDEQEVKNYFEILKSLESYRHTKLDQNIVLKIHNNLLSKVNNSIAGNFRNKSVVVGYRDGEDNLHIKHNPPVHNSESIKKLLDQLFKWINEDSGSAIINIGIFHHKFVYIHPFEDGNGRVCRLLTTLLFLQNNYEINKYFVLDDYYELDREKYSDSLHEADEGKLTKWLEYFTEGIKYSLLASLSKLESGLETLEFDLRPSKREKEAIEIIVKYKEITSGQLAEELGVGRKQSHNLLSSLVEKGFLKKFGSTKNSYYKLIT